MSFRRRILLALITVAVLPVLAMGVLSYQANREELLRTVGRSQAQAAAELARWCERLVVDRAQALQLSATYIPFASLSGSELETVLHIPLRQFPAADRVRRYTLFWAVAALVVALLLGTFVAGTLARPVADLSSAASALTEGRYDVRVEEGGGEELARLGAAFNHMAREVRRRDEEIRRWNAELQRRVQERTTELRAAEDQIARARRLAAMGSLGAGVAHGLNNPMTSLLGLITLARRDVAGAPTAELLETAIGEGRKIVRIVDDLKRLAERERNEAGRAFALAQPVRAAVDAQRRRLAEKRIALTTDLEHDVPLVQGHPTQVQELVAHLIDNAVAAMPDGGRLEIGLCSVEGDAVRLHVADDGRGIPPEIRERIFDPFFTTKSTAGAGLGLSLCHGIVEAHHGRIVVESAPGRGARFEVLLPAAARAAHLA